jgi:hypothetical protein
MRPGYIPLPELLNEGLNEWWAMYDGFNAQRTMAFSIPDYVYPIGSNTGLNGIYGKNVQFTIGPSFTVPVTLQSSVNVLCVNTAGLIVGQYPTGAGIPAGAYITTLAVNTGFTLSVPATASGPVTLTIPPTFAGPRPEAIVRMNLFLTSSNPAQPTRIPLAPLSAEEWAGIPVVQFTATNVATSFYYDPQFPQGVINIFPPLNGNSLEIFTWGFLTPPTALTSTYSAPPGYADVLIWELAKRLWPRCTHSVMPNKLPLQWLCGQAARAKDVVRAVNAPMPRMRNDFHGGGSRQAATCDWNLLLVGTPY